MSEPTDKELLDYLQQLTDETECAGGWIMLQSSTWGWWLGEKSQLVGHGEGFSNVRQAIAWEMARAAAKEKP